MCFSAHISFIVAGGLALTGLLSVIISKNRYELLLSLTPFIFAIQQAIEGILWIALPAHPLVASVATYSYLCFAYLFWPIWIPLAIACYEPEFWRKLVIFSSMLIGIILAGTFLKLMIIQGATSSIKSHHIVYSMNITSLWLGILLNLSYFMAVVAPFFISSRAALWMFGAAISISYVVIQIGYYAFSASLWCFAAATISGMIVYSIAKNQP